MIAAPDRLQAAFPAVQTGVSADEIPFVRLTPETLLEGVRRLGDELGYGRFVDLTAVDEPDADERFGLQYLFYSMAAHSWVRVKVRTAASAPSITPLFAGADWYEREVYDLFGVIFEGHPNLTRIQMPDDWDGHPLRKDYPMGGEPVDFTVTRDIYGTGDRRG
jgi:NADH-quinone oxidoreductase subunit C